MIIAVDFDGTLCRNAWPLIGKPRRRVIRKALRRHRRGDTLILWTCREGDRLAEAVAWCAEHGLVFDYVNENAKGLVEKYGNDCRKIGADVYVDDKGRFWWW
jgi:hypothetical protein